MAAGERRRPRDPRPRPRSAPPRSRRRRPAPPEAVLQEASGLVLLLPGARSPPRPRRRGVAPPRRTPRARGGARAPSPLRPPPAPQNCPPDAWGTRLPLPLLLRVLGAAVAQEGAVPLLCRVSRVCRLWQRAAAEPGLWHRVALGRCRDPEAAARWLGAGRLRRLRDFALTQWLSGVPAVLQALAAACPLLSSLRLRHCRGVTAAALGAVGTHCPRLESLDLQGSQVEAGAVPKFLAVAGARLRQMWLSCGPRTGAVLASLAGGSCPQLQLLEVDAGQQRSPHPLQVPVEQLQAACPQLQVLRLLNVSWWPRAAPRLPLAPGFPQLQELSLATTTGGGAGDAVLQRLLRASARLRLLDLRGCARVSPRALLRLPCADLEQLHLGLHCSACAPPSAPQGCAALAWRWRHSLRELDLAGHCFGEQDLAQALAAFGPGAPLRSLDLAGTRVAPEALSALLLRCPSLCYLDVSSCRRLPRGTKRAHRGPRELGQCLSLLLGAGTLPRDPPEPPRPPAAPPQPPGAALSGRDPAAGQ
ncbi:F-box/LRR-repeat protein 6 isoform X2 [Anser cygnoides]|uniref:F-box/LRR-repeat protein 6 isoform X2 n=1 Tax=Anser cygnoides TaxID=8845 RepID=UPI0034D2B8AE